jgi:hypothetical protein
VGRVRGVILELPFDLHDRTHLGDEIRALGCDRAEGLAIAIRPYIVMVVLDDNRVHAVVLVDRGG